MSKAPNQKALQDLLAQSQQANIYHLPHHGQTGLTKAAKALGFACFKVDLEESDHMGKILSALGHGLHFPEWYGTNLDALNDCLTDFSWREAPGYVITICGADAVHAESNSFAALNEIFAGAIAEWQARNIPFWIFYDLRSDGLATLPTLA
jgi:RNAse (barnase) inhibitor barstar